MPSAASRAAAGKHPCHRHQRPATAAVPNDLEAYLACRSRANRAFKAAPRLIARAKDMHYYTPDGRAVLDGAAGLWCTNAGHNRDPIVAAIQAQAAELDYRAGLPVRAIRKAFELASRIAALAPADLDHVFFCNSGSEAVDTALKIALAYHNVARRGRAHAPDRPRARLSRRRLRRHLGRRHRQQPQVVRRRCWPASTICRTPTTASSRRSPRASRNGARISPTSSSASSRCTTPPPSPP